MSICKDVGQRYGLDKFQQKLYEKVEETFALYGSQDMADQVVQGIIKFYKGRPMGGWSDLLEAIMHLYEHRSHGKSRKVVNMLLGLD